MYREDEIISMWSADMYDLDETDITDVNFAMSIIGPFSKRILEIGCGSGRYLAPLAKAGRKVAGLDFDEFMLKKIDAKLEDKNNVKWRKSDIIKEEWEIGFDVVLLTANILFNIVSNMEYEKAQKLLIEKSANSLLPDGHLLIDYSYPPYPEKWYDNPEPNLIWEGTDSHGNTGKMILLDNKFNKTNSTCTFVRRYEIISKNGDSIVRNIPTSKHFATLIQIQKWLSACGFVIEGAWGDYEKNPISENTNRAIIWARKL